MVTLSKMILMCVIGASEPSEDMLYRVVKAHSGGDPYLIVDVVSGKTFRPESMSEAVRVAEHLVEAGRDVRLGLAGISYELLEKARKELRVAFDPCESLSLAALELERLSRTKGVRAHKGDDRIHAWAASYFMPRSPMHEVALTFGAKVVVEPKVSVAKRARASRREAGFTYKSPKGMRLGARSAAYRPKKWPKRGEKKR